MKTLAVLSVIGVLRYSTAFVPLALRPRMPTLVAESPVDQEQKQQEDSPAPLETKEPQVLTEILPYLPEVEETQLEQDANYMKMALEEAVAE